MGDCLGKQQQLVASLTNSPSSSVLAIHSNKYKDADDNCMMIPFLSSKPLLLIEGFERESMISTSRINLIKSISELILKYFICTRRTIYHIGGDPIESKLRYSSIYNYKATHYSELEWLSDEITSSTTSPISNIFVMDSKFIVYFKNGNIVCYDDNIDYLDFKKDFNLKMIINNIHTICINSYQNGFKYDICCVDKINKNVLCFISSHIFDENGDTDNYYNYYKSSINIIGEEYIENISLHNHLYIDKYYISLKETDSNSDHQCDEEEEGEDININKVCLTDNLLYILTENGRLYHRGIFTITKQQSLTLKFKSHSNLNHIFITDIVCNEFVTFIIDQYGDVYCKGNQINNNLVNNKYGLLPNNNYKQFKIYKYFHDNTYITKIKQIALGSKHAIALDYDGSIYCWGHNKYQQLGFHDNNNNDNNDVFEIPHRLSIQQKNNNKYLINHTQINQKKKLKKKTKKRNIIKLIDDESDDDKDKELRFDSIVCGSNHSFIISVDDNNDNIVFGWGSNENNQLLLYNNKNNKNKNNNIDTLLPTRMGIIEKLMKYNKEVDIFVVGDATYLNIQHY